MLFIVRRAPQIARKAAIRRFMEPGGAPPPGVEMLGRWQALELPNHTSVCAEGSFCPGMGGCCGW
jgi:Protein of unknown function (DUF3303)